MQAVLSAHDIVAQKKFDPVLPPLPEDLDDDLEEESVKIVRLVKNKEPLVRCLKMAKSDFVLAIAFSREDVCSTFVACPRWCTRTQMETVPCSSTCPLIPVMSLITGVQKITYCLRWEI